MKAKARVPDPRGEQPERLAANEAGCGRISLRCASMRRKIALNSPGIRGMSAETAHRRVRDNTRPRFSRAGSLSKIRLRKAKPTGHDQAYAVHFCQKPTPN